jgi:LysM repeat protein
MTLSFNLIPLEKPKKEEEEEEETRAPPKGFHRHMIKEEDTLVGIALKYNVQVDAIKRANRLFGGHTISIYHRKDLLIPITPEFVVPENDDLDSHQSLIKAFKRKTGKLY